jgi:hypothetical protein
LKFTITRTVREDSMHRHVPYYSFESPLLALQEQSTSCARLAMKNGGGSLSLASNLLRADSSTGSRKSSHRKKHNRHARRKMNDRAVPTPALTRRYFPFGRSRKENSPTLTRHGLGSPFQ